MIPIGNKKMYYWLSGGITTLNPRLIMDYSPCWGNHGDTCHSLCVAGRYASHPSDNRQLKTDIALKEQNIVNRG